MPSDPHETCWTMLHAASAGDASARSTFAASYTAPIRAYLVHRWQDGRIADRLDDAMQDVFVECMKPGGVLDSADPTKGDFRALLYAVVRNVARRHEERASRPDRARDDSIHLDELPDRAEELSRYFDRAWARSIVRDAVLRHARASRQGDADMRRRYRVLRLRHQDGLPVREIAARFDEPNVDAVHNAYRRARREFRTFLRDAVAHHTGARPEALDAACRRVTALLGT